MFRFVKNLFSKKTEKPASEDDIVQSIKTWLGKDGIKFFTDIKNKHGTLNASWMENGIPHILHFREGMQVRNQLRDITNNSWTSHEYDDRWMEIVEKAISL